MNTNTTAYLERSLVEAIELAKVTGTNAITVLSREVPDLVEQIVKYNLLKLSLITCLYFVASILVACLSRYLYKKLKEWREGDGLEYMVAIVGTFVAIILFVFGFGHLLDLLKLITAPKLWLLEYAAKLLK